MLNFPRWKVITVVALCVFGILLAVPNVISRENVTWLPDWFPQRHLTLGLDLQGGSHLLMEVDVDSVFDARLEALVDGVRTEFRAAEIGYIELGVAGDAVQVKLRDPADAERARPILTELGLGMTLDIADDGTARMAFTDAEIARLKRDAIQRSIEIVRRRIDETGTREPTIQRQGDERILIQLPGVKDPERIKDLIGQTAKMDFRFIDMSLSPEQAEAGGLPPTAELLPSLQTNESGEPERWYVVNKRIIVSGENLTDAQATFQQNQPVVSFRFDSVGGKRFADATSQNIGKLFAIVLDGKVISAPVIQSAILGGSGIIEGGNMTVESANDLALLLRAGALPAPLTVLEERTVGADLGADSIAAGTEACLIGLALVIVMMVVLYGFFGIIANVALILNGILLLGLLSALEATLTLPGIAGIALTLGMAVDANVLIFERIREEMRNGRGPLSAVDSGYREAMSTIIDANLTTLISTLILFMFGSGPVKGFAVTLSLGIITSVFTAVVVSRMIVGLWLRRTRPQTLPL
ncbi:MAG: protein translocase subunit SecD [Rhodospirillaceae bacterium]|nr:protein translocase subunit SecD [Rhodospirillaceae bacterium]